MNLPIVFFLVDTLPIKNILNDDGSEKSFQRLAELAKLKNIDLRFVLGENSYKNGVFNNYWKYQNGTFIQINDNFTASIIYKKGLTHLFDDIPRVNSVYLEKVSSDKLLTAQLFPNHVKRTIEINTDNVSDIYNLEGDLIVIKPRYGNNGDNISFISKDSVTKDLIANDNYIAQELIDSSKGISGLIAQRHEMRVYVSNGRIIAAYLRLPPHDSYLSNIVKGATEKQIENSDIPETFIKVVEEVDDHLKDVSPRLYCIDIMNELGKPWIVELNGSPGLPDVNVQPLADNYFNALLDLLVDNSI